MDTSRLRRRDLERALEGAPPFLHPDPGREQHRTPAPVAADLLWAAMEAGHLGGRRVLDLGCGTGVFAVGAALCGAREVLGVDVDGTAVAEAREWAAACGVGDRVSFLEADLEAWHPEPGWDAVVMNPPFGAQHGNRRGDRLFYRRAFQALAPRGGTVWLLALPTSQRFLAAWARDAGVDVQRVAEWDYPLPAEQPFHREAVRMVHVGGYRMDVPSEATAGRG